MFDDPTYPVKMGKFFSIISKPLKTTWPIVACAGSYNKDITGENRHWYFIFLYTEYFLLTSLNLNYLYLYTQIHAQFKVF